MKSIIVHTPIGMFKISEADGFITEVKYQAGNEVFEQQESILLSQARQQIYEYFEGIRKNFDLPLKITGSEFTQKVLLQLAKVPYGATVTYGELAALCGSPKAARAVGSIMRKNPIAIVLPCHRVVPTGEKIGNYSAGGSANKDWLLTFEKQNSVPVLQQLIFGI